LKKLVRGGRERWPLLKIDIGILVYYQLKNIISIS
jgi:hypothetical protein